MRTRLSKLLLPTLVALALTGAAHAGGRGGQPSSPPATANHDLGNPRPVTTLPDSVRRVERQTGGEVLRAEPMQQDGREVYRLKVLTRDGRVRVVQDDPAQPADDEDSNAAKHKRGTPTPKADKDG